MTTFASEPGPAEWAWKSGVARPSEPLSNASLDVEAIVEENARLRAVLGHCPKCIAVVDDEGGLVGYNREFAALFPTPPSLTTRLSTLFEATDEAMLEDVVRAASTGNRAAALVRLDLGESEEKAVEFIVATLPARDGTVLGVILAGEERTSTMKTARAQAQTVQSIEELNCLAALDLGRSLLGHELTTHLTTIGLAVDALAHPDAERSQWVHQAKESLGHALALLTRPRTGSVSEVVETPSADARSVANDAIHAVRGTRGFSINPNFRNTVPAGVTVRLGGREMAQVMVNLLSNGACAVEGKGRRGAVSIFAEERAPGVVELYVRDNGQGIEPRDLGDVFEVGVTTRPETTGRGLGLAIVRAIVERVGGSVRIYSEPGAGTEVVVSLPGERQASLPAPQGQLTGTGSG